MPTVSAYEARQNFAELLELAFYKDKQFLIRRNKKPMARLVGEPFMASVSRLVDYIMEHEPTLADTLAIELDDGIRKAITRSRKEAKQGKLVPIETILND